MPGKDYSDSRRSSRYDTVMILDEFYERTEYSKKPTRTFKQKCLKQIKKCRVKKCCYSILPILEWMRTYTIRPDLISDLIAGITVAILSVPQSMAYAILAFVPPQVGLYMAFFPPLVYFLLGTSKQNSIGTFAVVCLMTGKVVLKFASSPDWETANEMKTGIKAERYSPIEVATVLAFIVGGYQIIIYIFRLGIASKFLSEHLIAGFTTASALHVYITQIPEILGLSLPKRIGYFKPFYVISDCFAGIKDVNCACLILSSISGAVLMCSNWFIKPWLAKKTMFPIPTEFILVIITTLISKYIDLKNNFHVKIVGTIPTGIPVLTVPRFELISTVAVDALSISIVSYALTISVALMLASRNFYEIDCNQEALALGLSNVIGSFFQCIPCCTSLSRTLVQEAVGGRTQVASVFSCVFILIVLLKLGPFFEPLPKATLAVIIIIALRNAVLQILNIRKYWHLSKVDTMLFLTTFSCVMFIDIDIGLLIGFSMSLFIIMYQGMKPYACILGQVPKTDIYLNIRTHKRAKEIPRIKIFHYAGGLSFAQTVTFRNELYTLLNCDPLKVARARKDELQERGVVVTFTKLSTISDAFEYMNPNCFIPFQVIIWDFSGISYIDSSGVKQVSVIAKYFRNLNITVLLACPSDPVFETLRKCDEKAQYIMYPTIHDAVKIAKLLTKSN